MIAETKRVVFLSPSLKFGGMERVMSILANHLATKSNFKVELILFGINPEVFYPLNPKIKITITEISPNQNRIIFTLKTIFWLRRRLKSNYKIHAISFGEYWNSFLLISLFGIRNVSVTISDRMDPLKVLKFPHEFLRKTFYPFANNIIFQSKYAKGILENRINIRRSTVIPNPINPDIIGGDSNYNNRLNQVLYVGRIIESKNVPLLIKSFKASNIKDWELKLVGDNDLKEENDVWLNELKNEKSIEHISKTIDVKTYYSKAKIFAFPSLSEGFPNVVLEALFSGLKVLVYGLPIYSDDIFSKFQNLHIASSEDDFSNRLAQIMLDDSEPKEVGWDITGYNNLILGNFQNIF